MPDRKQPVRIITVVWGEAYLTELLEASLRSILAPGNLPALAEMFDCEFVLVTEERLFPIVESDPTFQRLKTICKARLVMLDDLVVSRQMYGMSLTFALHRGFEDLGERMCEHFLVFFNSDFVIADGSWKKMGEKMLSGERLIFAPSYCVISENVTASLKSKLDRETGVLTLSKRDMARMILDNRHGTVRAKTLNRQTNRMNVSDQFYWHVDDDTLIGRQLPIAIVCMKPEKVHTQPLCFWDYATITCACPTIPRCVLGDSDDFLMMELRSQSTYAELMVEGGANKEETAAVLGGYMTADQLEMGRYDLTLHAKDLPISGIPERQLLREYVDGVYALVPAKPVSYINHQYWRHSIESFLKLKEEWWSSREIRGATKDEAVSVRTRRQNCKAAIQWAYRRSVGVVPDVKLWHPYFATLLHVAKIVRRELEWKSARVVLIDSGSTLFEKLVKSSGHFYNHISASSLLKHNMPQDARNVTLCLCDLDWTDLRRFPEMFFFIRKRMKKGGRVVVFHSSENLRSLDERSKAALLAIAPDTDAVSFKFGGSRGAAAVLDHFRSGLAWASHRGRLRSVWTALLLIFLAPLSVLAGWRAMKRRPSLMPDECTSVTLEIEIL